MQKGYIKPSLGVLGLLMQQQRIKQEAIDLRSFPDLSGTAISLISRLQAIGLLYAKQIDILAAKGLETPLMEIEMPTAAVLSSMECVGICLDPNAYARHKGPLQRRQEQVRPSTPGSPECGLYIWLYCPQDWLGLTFPPKT